MRNRLNRRATTVLLAAFAFGGALVGREHRADACGGCFVAPTERSVVTDHRMAFSISPEQTVLWDQIRYSGDPREFAWVLPVHPGARVELSHDEWFAALDATTQPVITGPAPPSNGGGCSLGCGGASDSALSAPSGGSVQIIKQGVVGPYETVTLRSTDPTSLTDWLRQHGFDIPAPIQPTIDDYVSEGFDFIALRLRPVCSERAMKPVRIVSPGADASLPLRMVAAGVGANVGITLYVVSEGRYRPQNFLEATLSDDQLTWNSAQNRSNYEELSQSIMAGSSGRTWLNEFAGKVDVTGRAYGSPGGYVGTYYGNPGLGEAYSAQCVAPVGSGVSGSGAPSGTTCESPSEGDPSINVYAPYNAEDASSDASDAASSGDASDAASSGDASDAASSGDASDAASSGDGDAHGGPLGDAAGPSGDSCAGFDDLDVATTGLHAKDVWVTRLRAVLPSDALRVGDLRLEASPDQTPVSNYHQARRYADGSSAGSSSNDGCASAPRRHDAFGSLVLAGATLLGIASILQRRR